MINLFGDEYERIPTKKQDPQKRAWENAFQKWSNSVLFDERNHYGACGYGVICDFCKDNSYGRPCVRALNAMCRERFIGINYNDKSTEYYEKLFDGRKE